MTRDEIIKGLENEISRIHREPKGKMLGIFMTVDEAEDIVTLLKEQEAKPLIVTNAYGTRFYHCPKCNRELYAYIRQRYCSNCGQKVKWND